MQLYLVAREPRTLVLVPTLSSPAGGERDEDDGDDRLCLVLRKPPSDNPTGSQPSLVVELLPRREIEMAGAVLLVSRVQGCLGVLRIADGPLLLFPRPSFLSAEPP